MSCHHHHHHSSCCCCCQCHTHNTCCSSLSPPSPPAPPPSIIDHHHLLQTLLLLQPQPPQPPKPQIYNSNNNNKDLQHTQSLLHSLLRRVANLEASSSSPPPQTPPQTPLRPAIKHLAAITIQTHFRRFLARRSRTLRDLNRLAAIKSQASSLKSSLSQNSNPNQVSRVAVDLLTQLDSIKSRDVMIREGKRAVARELVRVTEFVDKVLAGENDEESGGGGRRSGTRVRFTENGSGHEVFDEMSKRVYEVPEGDDDGLEYYEEIPRERGGNVGLSAPLPVTMEQIRNARSM